MAASFIQLLVLSDTLLDIKYNRLLDKIITLWFEVKNNQVSGGKEGILLIKYCLGQVNISVKWNILKIDLIL